MGWFAGRYSCPRPHSWAPGQLELADPDLGAQQLPGPLPSAPTAQGRSVFPPGSPACPRGASPSSPLCPSASFHGLIAHSSSDAEQAPGGEGCQTGKAALTRGFSMRAAWGHLQVRSQAPLQEGLWSRFHSAGGYSHLRSESLSRAHCPSPHKPAGLGGRDEPRLICESPYFSPAAVFLQLQPPDEKLHGTYWRQERAISRSPLTQIPQGSLTRSIHLCQPDHTSPASTLPGSQLPRAGPHLAQAPLEGGQGQGCQHRPTRPQPGRGLCPPKPAQRGTPHGGHPPRLRRN